MNSPHFFFFARITDTQRHSAPSHWFTLQVSETVELCQIEVRNLPLNLGGSCGWRDPVTQAITCYFPEPHEQKLEPGAERGLRLQHSDLVSRCLIPCLKASRTCHPQAFGSSLACNCVPCVCVQCVCVLCISASVCVFMCISVCMDTYACMSASV